VHGEQLIEVRSQEWREVFDRIKVATRLSSRLSEYCVDEDEEIRRSFEKLIGKSVGESFHLVPPFYSDYGLNITVGRDVFIGCQCAFNGHAAITIADEVMIAPQGQPRDGKGSCHPRRSTGDAGCRSSGESCQGPLRRTRSFSSMLARIPRNAEPGNDPTPF
jgi:acetyltransferase-like isoleucine patch superfamily enzyme